MATIATPAIDPTTGPAIHALLPEKAFVLAVGSADGIKLLSVVVVGAAGAVKFADVDVVGVEVENNDVVLAELVEATAARLKVTFAVTVTGIACPTKVAVWVSVKSCTVSKSQYTK